ncbi:sugar phosphate isomerase/epimerase family protein [Actomonas aquatica]|uniref:Sugar phosphate isomerase/epimerase family protein n=1 Tax=Actomonas aquatica TaxID=2866162 RepID=A0ABZ1CF68_9BACT|nr:sugar phosphate isomerase/epimerase family protein [Opitutus sp. WL0086]WRQ90005.1 sugar phosphate isomerase/epimerase family protein [Opitutus sp. WL0086]
MKLGIHAYAWCSQWTNDTLDLIDRVAGLGLDFIEIPLMCLDTFDAPAIKARLDAVGLGAVTSTVLLADTDITSDDPAVRERGRAYLEDCVRATAAIGASSFSGVIYSRHPGSLRARPTEEHWQRSADGLRPAAKLAGELGVLVGIEPVNRYESYLINTCAQARELMARIDAPAMRIHLDTYHMNIEEKSFADATLLAGSDLIHYHLCENDRGIPGTGQVDWDGIFRSLAALNYQGNAALESFVDNTDNMNTWVWRQLAPDGDTLLREGVDFIRRKQREHGLL